MKILSVTYVGSFRHLQQLPKKRLPEIGFAGRSNVGKSSLLNCLVQRKNLARTSSTPGKTRSLNYYAVNDTIYLVDLPGYGYAHVPLQERQEWKRLLESYFEKNPYLQGVVQIIDSRHPLSPLDQEMIDWLARLQLPTLAVATKIDKLSRSQAQHQLQLLTQELGQLGVEGLIPFSAVTKQGRKELWQAIDQLVEQRRANQ
ncbi:MAG: ribosome biogenesis GTP-binding protein YihA/YsxC [candidate division KSB1 bacterium]|nr:ribosome biogenesis GTP-binding protein YihA/YsxC [candidate division KSB1 bacterium]